MYWAFISYSSSDQRVASWLFRKLENYTVPNEFRGATANEMGVAIEKYLRPIFRDRDELAGSEKLSEDIQEALRNSLNLIVLCSPSSSSSLWVNKEIEDYRRLRPNGHILPIIIKGEPNSENSSEECFPPALRLPVEPLAGDFRKDGDGRERGFLKIAAAIIGTNFDKLYQRHERRRRKVRLFLGFFATSLILMFASLTMFAFYQKDIAKDQADYSEAQSRAIAGYAAPYLNQQKAELNLERESLSKEIPSEYRSIKIGFARLKNIDEKISVIENLVSKESRYHPMPAEFERYLGAENDYAEMYIFHCCNRRVITGDGKPLQFRPDGCKQSPYIKQGGKDFLVWAKSRVSDISGN